MSQRKPTALDWIMGYADGIADPKKIAAARRELQVKTELCEAYKEFTHGRYASWTEHDKVAARLADALNAYRKWRAEQEQQT